MYISNRSNETTPTFLADGNSGELHILIFEGEPVGGANVSGASHKSLSLMS